MEKAIVGIVMMFLLGLVGIQDSDKDKKEDKKENRDKIKVVTPQYVPQYPASTPLKKTISDRKITITATSDEVLNKIIVPRTISDEKFVNLLNVAAAAMDAGKRSISIEVDLSENESILDAVKILSSRNKIIFANMKPESVKINITINFGE